MINKKNEVKNGIFTYITAGDYGMQTMDGVVFMYNTEENELRSVLMKPVENNADTKWERCKKRMKSLAVVRLFLSLFLLFIWVFGGRKFYSGLPYILKEGYDVPLYALISTAVGAVVYMLSRIYTKPRERKKYIYEHGNTADSQEAGKAVWELRRLKWMSVLILLLEFMELLVFCTEGQGLNAADLLICPTFGALTVFMLMERNPVVIAAAMKKIKKKYKKAP